MLLLKPSFSIRNKCIDYNNICQLASLQSKRVIEETVVNKSLRNNGCDTLGVK